MQISTNACQFPIYYTQLNIFFLLAMHFLFVQVAQVIIMSLLPLVNYFLPSYFVCRQQLLEELSHLPQQMLRYVVSVCVYELLNSSLQTLF